MGGGMLMILLLIVIAYLTVGAYIFMALEGDHEISRQADLLQELRLFLENHTCITKNTLRVMLEYINKDLYTARYVLNHNETQNVMWDSFGAINFVFSVVTTIGYGNITPRTVYGRIACIIYAIIGIPLILVYLKGVGENLCTLATRCYGCQFRLCKFYTCQPHRRLYMFLLGTLGLAILLGMPPAVFAYMEDWTVVDAVYFWFVTLTTIGFGDLVAGNPLTLGLDESRHSPKKAAWRTFKLLVSLVGLSVVSMIITSIARYFLASTNIVEEGASNKMKVLAKRCTGRKSNTVVSPDKTPSTESNKTPVTSSAVPLATNKDDNGLADAVSDQPQLVRFSPSSDSLASAGQHAQQSGEND